MQCSLLMTQACLPDVICTCYSGSCVSSGGAPTPTGTSMFIMWTFFHAYMWDRDGGGGHSWLKMGGAFVIWGIYNLNGAVMAKWDIVLGDMLEKTLVFRESLWTPLRFTLISAHSSILIKVFFILRSSAVCTNYSADQPCLLTGRHGSLIVHLRQSIVLILSSLCFYVCR